MQNRKFKMDIAFWRSGIDYRVASLFTRYLTAKLLKGLNSILTCLNQRKYLTVSYGRMDWNMKKKLSYLKKPKFKSLTLSPFLGFSFMQNQNPPPIPVPCFEKMHLLWLKFFNSLKILIKKTCLYFHEPTDDLFFQAKKHCVLD